MPKPSGVRVEVTAQFRRSFAKLSFDLRGRTAQRVALLHDVGTHDVYR